MLKRTDDRASVPERRKVCARHSGAANSLLFGLFVWLAASDRSWADYSPIYCTAGVDPLLAVMKGGKCGSLTGVTLTYGYFRNLR
jgi:hypothetical protein